LIGFPSPEESVRPTRFSALPFCHAHHVVSSLQGFSRFPAPFSYYDFFLCALSQAFSCLLFWTPRGTSSSFCRAVVPSPGCFERVFSLPSPPPFSRASNSNYRTHFSPNESIFSHGIFFPSGERPFVHRTIVIFGTWRPSPRRDSNSKDFIRRPA